MDYMFNGATAFNGDLSEWDVSAVTSMWCMFDRAPAFNGDLSKWDVSTVTNMEYMFQGATAFNQDLSPWDVSVVNNMACMFQDASSFKYSLCGSAWVNSKADKWRMFERSPGSISKVCRTDFPGFNPQSKAE